MEIIMINSKLLIQANDKIEIVIYLGVDEKGELYASHKKEELTNNDKIATPEEEYLQVKMFFRRPSYRDDVDLMSNTVSQKVDASGESFSINPAIIKYSRFTQLFSDWDLTDDKGKKIPATVENVDKLHPALANAAVAALEAAL